VRTRNNLIFVYFFICFRFLFFTLLPRHPKQGCQMVYFQNQNPNLSKFWRVLDWKNLIYFWAIWNILRTFGIFYGLLGCFMTIWYICCSFGFGIMYHEKSGNPLPKLLLVEYLRLGNKYVCRWRVLLRRCPNQMQISHHEYFLLTDFLLLLLRIVSDLLKPAKF
jgi:hypothetical protein